MIHLVLLPGLVLDYVQENVDRGLAVLGRWAIPAVAQKGDGREMVKERANRGIVI